MPLVRRYRGSIRHFRQQAVFASIQRVETARRSAVPLARRLTERSSRGILGFQRQKYLGVGRHEQLRGGLSLAASGFLFGWPGLVLSKSA